MKNKKRLLLGLCCALMISTASAGLAACEFEELPSSSSSSDIVGGFEGGEFYAGGTDEAATGANTLSLDFDGTVTLKIDDNTLTGTYVFVDDVFTISFADSTATATFEDGVITLTYNGTEYTFVEKVEYTVSYSVDGTVTSTKKVVNGRPVSAPTAPVKQNYVFAGWYTDSAFKNAFAFGTTPITANITLYARFVEAVEEEFTVTFMVDGEKYQEVKTTGAVVAQLPTPTKTGVAFKGWWIGDGEGKLSAQYQGQVLNQNTILYAVWDDGTPIVSVSATAITWEAKGVNNSYTVRVTAPDGTTESFATTMATYAYDFASKVGGEYKIEVILNGKTGTAYYKNKYLATVSNFSVVGSELVFNGVENATKYLISSSCGTASHVHKDYDNGSSTVYDFSVCEMKEGGITFTVKAVAEGWVSSEATFTVERSLAAPTVSVDKATESVTWAPVENASEYQISLNGSVVMTVPATETSFDMRSYRPMNWNVRVTAKAYGYHASSASVVYDKTSLVTPTNVKLEATKLTWNEVAGATGYKVKIGDNEYTATTNEFTLTSEHLDANATSCAIQVKAVGATAEQDSLYGDAVTVSFNEMSKNVAYVDGKLTWDPVLNVRRYEVMFNGAVFAVDAAESSCDINFTRDGEQKIRICCVKADNTRSDWVEITVRAYATEFEVAGGRAVATVYAVAGDTIVLPESVKAGYDFAGWFNTPNGTNGTQYEAEIAQAEGDMTIYAHWTARKYTANLNAGEGTVEPSVEVTFDQNYVLPRPSTTSEDVFFGGWYTEENGRGIKYADDEGNSVNVWRDTQAVTLHAYWMKDVLNYVEVDDEETGEKGYEVYGGRNATSLRVIRIPATYNGKNVISIASDAFKNCSGLVRLEMPDTIQSIVRGTSDFKTGDSFHGCNNLNEFVVYETEGGHDRHYETIDGVLVRNYQGEKELVYMAPGTQGKTFVIPEGVTMLPDNVFARARYEKIVIPATVTKISAYAFNYAYYMKEVEFLAPETDLAEDGSNGLAISEYAFNQCHELTTITLPARTLKLADSIATDESVPVTFSLIFYNCADLEKIHVAAPETEGACYYSSFDGIICNQNGSEVIYCHKNRKGAIEFPAAVSSIAENAFYGCSTITSVKFHAFVTSIGKGAFEKCSGLTSVTFEGKETDGAIDIASRAFYGCSGLTNVKLPANLGTLEAYAFGGTSGLTDVTVEVGANAKIKDTAFGTDAASPYFSVTTVHIGANVPVMNVAAVFGSEKLINLTVDEANPNYMTDENGVLYNKVVGDDGEAYPTEILFYPVALVLENYEIPSTITAIGAEVFTGRTFKSITIGENVTSIGANAFADCKYLETVTFANANAALTEDNGLTIGTNAFYKCENLTMVTLPVRLTSIGDTAFSGCYALAGKLVIPENVTKVGKQAFLNCEGITEVEVLGETTDFTMESNKFTVFKGCASLATIKVAEGNEKYVTENGVLYVKKGGVATELVYCPAACVGEVVTEDGVSTNVLYVPNTVTTVWASAFEHSMALESVVFEENATNPVDLALKANSFKTSSGSQLKSVVLPKGMTTIAASSFENSTITSITIPNTVKSVGNKAFKGNTHLETVYFAEGGTAALTLGTASSTTSNGPFYGCTALKSVNLPERLTVIGGGSFYNTALTELTIPSTVTQIWNGVFQSCESLAKVTITDTEALPSQLKNIKGAAFRGTGLTEINFPDTVTEIAGGAFNETQLVEITLPAGLTTLSTAFYKIATLEKVTFAANNKVTALPNQAFDSCTSLKEITIPSNVKTIGNRAFNGCSSLEKVTFATKANGKTALTKIDYGAFAGTALTEFILPETSASSLTFSYNMFSGCKQLKKVQLPKQVTSLSETFMGCLSIEEVLLPDNANLIFEDGILYNADKTAIQYVMKDIATENLVIPDGVTTIGVSAFATQPSLKTVSLPASIKEIGSSAFENCYNLEKVTFRKSDGVAETLKSINTYTFSGCTSLTEIVGLPSTLTSIADYAFSGCASLVRINSTEDVINLPENLTKIGTGSSNTRVFADCVSIKKVMIPAGVTKIAGEAFDTCTALSEVVFAEGSKLTTIANRAFEACTSLKNFVMPDTVTTMNYGVFASSGIENIHLSTKLTTMNAQAFMDAVNLKSIELPEGLLKIEYATFQGCTALEEITIPSTVTQIQDHVFFNCTSLTEVTIPESVKMFSQSSYGWNTSRNSYVFSGCTSLKTVDLGGVTQIGAYAFENCTALENIDLSKVTDTNQYAFIGCTALKAIDLSSLAKPQGYEFVGCTNLESVTFGSSLKSISNYMFQDCVKLASVEIPTSVTGTGIGNYAFQGCTSLTEMTIPSQITKIAEGMFSGCINLENVKIEGKITQIGNYAFQGCEKITEFNLPSTVTVALGNRIFEGTSITSITIPKAYVKVWNGVIAPFAGCETLTEILVADGNPVFSSVDGILYDADNNIAAIPNGKTFENDTFVVPEGVGITAKAMPFAGCSIKKVVLPESLTVIPQSAFREALVEEVVLGSQVDYIDDWAFYDATALKSVLKKNAEGEEVASLEGITTIDSMAFYNTASLESIVLPDTLTTLASSMFTYSGVKSVTFGAGITAIPASTFRYSGLTSIEIPSTITSIGNYAFADTAIESFTLPATVTSVGTYLLYNCTALTNVTLADGVTAIPNYMFDGCTALTEITLPDSVTSIGNYAFAGTGLTSIELPAEVTSIGNYAFQNTGLTSVEIPAAVTSIGMYAFYNTPLASVTLNEGLTSIGNYVFADTALTSVTLPSTLTSIGNYAFAGCEGITEIVLPAGLTSIGTAAFEGTTISSIVIPANATPAAGAFSGWTSEQTIYVTISEYIAANTWSLNWKSNAEATIVYNYVQE